MRPAKLLLFLRSMNSAFALCLCTVFAAACTAQAPPDEVLEQRPKSGDTAPDFKLASLDGKQHQLSKITKESSVVLLVLRGYPGYQCPICSRQVGEYIVTAPKFAEKGLNVLLVYPGAVEGLSDKASKFLGGKDLPSPVTMLIDQDYAITNAYDLRWDAQGETAYPATFVIDPEGVITFVKVSDSHGGRTYTSEVLALFEEEEEESEDAEASEADPESEGSGSSSR